jgi:hypothetical protein
MTCCAKIARLEERNAALEMENARQGWLPPEVRKQARAVIDELLEMVENEYGLERDEELVFRGRVMAPEQEITPNAEVRRARAALDVLKEE